MKFNFEVAVILVLFVAMFTCGYLARDIEGQFVADAYLTEKVQEQQWTINGLSQHVKQYEENTCSHVLIETQLVEVSR